MKASAARVIRYTLVALVAATLVGLAEATQVHTGMANAGRSVTWARSLSATMPSWYVLAALIPLVILVARRFPVETLKTPRSLAAHFLAAIVFALVHLAISGYLSDFLFDGTYSFKFSVAMWRLISMYFVGEITQYMGIVGVYFAYDYARRYREKERATAELALKASRLEASLTRANLEALRMQLNPHFLFNTLNTISVLALKGERQRVSRMLSRLGDLLRLSLENDRQTISLREELGFLERYLEIEQVRFRDRLGVSIDVDDAAYEAEVPSLILQPIVENALKYGFSQTLGPGRVSITCRVRSNTLELDVADTGPGFPQNRVSSASTGVGIANTRARLEQLYGATYTLELTNRKEGGALVLIRIPYVRHASEVSDHPQLTAKQA
jgi:two-component system, LytTR family, sensor kinase